MTRLQNFGLLLLTFVLSAAPPASRADEVDPWPSLKTAVFGDREILEEDGLIKVYTSDIAENSAVVPVSIRLPPGRGSDLKTLYLIVDRNPSPVAATIRFGDAFAASSDLGERLFETRLRVDMFAHLRVIAETKDGKLHMTKRFVQGSGGCSGIGPQDPSEAIAQLGAVKVQQRSSSVRGEAWREGVVMIRHPNFTGMQLNPKTRAYTPLRIVDNIEVTAGGELLFRVEGGISISENPHFRFNYESLSSDPIEVRASDTEGVSMFGRSPAPGS